MRLHWSVPLGALIFTGGIRPAAWLGFLLIILVHEMGHGVAVRAAGARVVSVDVHGMGGYCRWSGSVAPVWRACIAFAGVWAQVALMCVAFALRSAWGDTFSSFQRQLFWTLTATNAMNAALNLLPVVPLDGAQAWNVIPIVWRRLWPYVRRERFEWEPEPEKPERVSDPNRE